jgi:hypothetical protein
MSAEPTASPMPEICRDWMAGIIQDSCVWMNTLGTVVDSHSAKLFTGMAR